MGAPTIQGWDKNHKNIIMILKIVSFRIKMQKKITSYRHQIIWEIFNIMKKIKGDLLIGYRKRVNLSKVSIFYFLVPFIYLSLKF